MFRARTFSLALLGFFTILLVGALVVEFLNVGYFRFAAGTRPVIDQKKPPEPILPPIRDEDPVRGSQKSNAITIVEFADFLNPATKRLEPELQKALKESPIPVRLIWRDAPKVADGPLVVLAALAGRCAQEQGKFWAMHDALLHSAVMNPSSLESIAVPIVPNKELFSACVKKGKPLDAIRSDGELAETNHIIDTPLLFIGNRTLSGSVTAGDIAAAIRKATLK